MKNRPLASTELWAWVRTVLGLLQMIGAIVAALMLLDLGVTLPTVCVWLVTMSFTAVSVLLFRILKVHEKEFPMPTESLKKYFAECLGTFALVFAGTGAIVINDVTGGTVTHVGIAMTFGLVVLAMIYALGDVSGAHLNPAVTLGFLAARRFDARQVAPYLISQCFGAIVASLLLRFLFPQHTTLGATIPAGFATQSFVLEVVLTSILMFVILSVSTGAKERGITAGIAVGAVIGLEALFAGPICGASMNPARSLSPALVSGHLNHVWIYLTAPIAGALIAVLACRCARNERCCCSVPPDTAVVTPTH